MAYNPNAVEQVKTHALETSAANIRRTTEQSIEHTTRLMHALVTYREVLNDDVSGNVAEVLTAVSHKFEQINAAYANAYKQLGIAADLMSRYERL